MVARRNHILSAWTGFSVVLIGFLSYVVSYFLLPLYVTTLNCFDYCSPAKHPTMWEFSLNGVSHLSVTPVASSVVLLLCYVPLFGAVMVVGCSVAFLMHPRPALISWGDRGLLAGSVALVIFALVSLLTFISLVDRPHFGYLGILVGYGMFWGGRRFFLRAL